MLWIIWFLWYSISIHFIRNGEVSTVLLGVILVVLRGSSFCGVFLGFLRCLVFGLRRGYAVGVLAVRILRPHYFGLFRGFVVERYSIYLRHHIVLSCFFREFLCVLHLLDQNNICCFKQKKNIFLSLKSVISKKFKTTILWPCGSLRCFNFAGHLYTLHSSFLLTLLSPLFMWLFMR